MIQTGVQIKAGAFPPQWRWRADLEELAEAGVSLIVFPIPWCLAERAPGRFDFSLFSAYLREAEVCGMRVILTPVAEPPAWIQERCFEQPEYRNALFAFFRALGAEFGEKKLLDAWRLELLSLDDCRCPKSLELFRKFLRSEFSSIRELNARWFRNYFSFDQIPPETPECLPDSPESMAFFRFRRLREAGFFKELAALLQPGGRAAAALLLPPRMSGLLPEKQLDIAVSVEQDESYAERTAVLASSSETFCREGICVMERSPGFQAAPAQLTPGRLYRFLWNATAYGAKRIVLGEWDKDSLFNQLTSDDFLFADRLNALKRFRGQTEAAADLLEKWAPETGTVAVFRSRISERLLQVKGFYLKSALASLRGWVRSLTFSSTPFSVCSEESLDVLKDKKLLILPGTPVITNAAAEKILDFVHAGGILLCEPECGAWSSTGVPLRPDSRFIAEATGVLETARMVPDSPVLKFKTNKKICTLDSGSYVVPLRVVKKYTEVLIPYRNGTALAESIPYGKGKILLFGAFIGASAASARSPGLEDFLNTLLNAVVPKINLISRNCRVVSGFSGKSRMLFVFGSETAEKMIELHFHKTFWKKLALRDLVSGRRITVSSADNIRKIKFIPDSSGVAVLVEEGVLS